MKLISILICAVAFSRSEPVGRVDIDDLPLRTRRIQNGKDVGETRPYMVYLRPASQSPLGQSSPRWCCGGVIIHARYILTSAACIEDVKNFYVVSGTHTWISIDGDSECIRNGAKKAVWKCVPQDYYFDGAEFENIRWMSGDIAVVKVEDNFNFEKRVKGCDFTPKMLQYNNVSQDLEKSGTMASIAGWGSVSVFGDVDIGRTTENSPALLETDVQIISKTNCKKRWEPRYHNIIDNSMICTRDDQDSSQMSQACIDHGVNCKELEYSNEYSEEKPDLSRARTRRLMVDPKGLEVHGAWHQAANATRRYKVTSGGFCENDHGGPLIVGHGATSMVIGIISACITKDITKKCYGPYLYTSVWTYRHLINCAIDKDIGSTETCRRAFGEMKSPKNEISQVLFQMKRFVTQPMDVIKLRTQLQKKVPAGPKRKWFFYTRKIFREEGINAFWHGHILGQIYSIIGVSSQFFFYEMATKYVANTHFDKTTKHGLVFMSGIFAGCASATLVLPLEVIRVRQMLVKQQYSGVISGAKKVYASGGVLAFYEGLTATLLQMGPQVGISFCVFRYLQPQLLSYMQHCREGIDGHCRHGPSASHRPEYLLLASSLAGGISGFISKTMTYPFDLAKRRMQIGTHKVDMSYNPPSTSKHLIKCRSLFECLTKTVKYEGFFGLYRGWKVTVAKAQLTSVVAYTSYEMLCYAFREFQPAT